MNDVDDQFESQLRQDLSNLAGRVVTGPTPAQVLKRLRRRTLRRRAGAAGALAAIIVAAAAAVMLSSPAGEKKNEFVTDTEAALRTEIACLQAEAELRTVMVDHMLALESQDRLNKKLRKLSARPDPAEQIALSVEEAAFVILHHADRVRQEDSGREAAVAAYRQVVTLFPRTRWAEVARKRLSEIDKS